MKELSTFVSGLIFGIGLVISGMTNPNKVIGFLDFMGDWDPSLGLVMVGAIGVHATLFQLILRRPSPFLEEAFRIPSRRDIDGRLVGGAALFGIGWGLGGFCPGPGLVSTMSGSLSAWVFLGGLVAGMVIFHLVSSRLWATSTGSSGHPAVNPKSQS